MPTQILQQGPLQPVFSQANPISPLAFILPLGSYVLQMAGDGGDAGLNAPPTLSLYQGSTTGTLLGTLNTVTPGPGGVTQAYTGILQFQTDGTTLTITIAAGATGAMPGEITVYGN